MSRPWLVLMMLVVPAVASAKPKVALAPFTGDTKDHARHAVAGILDRDAAVVEDRDDADAVVQGKVSKEDKGNVLRVQLFVHGKKETTFYVPYTDLASKKFKRAVHDHVMSKLAKTDDDDAKPAKSAKKVAKADDDDKPAKKVAKADKPAKKEAKADDDDVKGALRTAKSDDEKPAKADEDDDKPAKKAKKRVARSDDADADGDNDDAPSIAKTAPLAEPGRRGMGGAAVIVEGGVSVTSRLLTYSHRGFDQAPPSYHNAGVPGARVAGEAYPLALLAPNSPASGIGIAGSYDKTMGLSVAAPPTLDAPANQFSVDQHAWSIGGRYRYGWVTFAADYGHHAFEIKRTDAGTIDVPDVDYAGFEPGLDVRVPLGQKFAVRAGGRAMLLKSSGPIQSNDSYGRMHITGGHAMVGLDVAVANRVALRLAGEAMMLKMTFYGTGIESTSRDLDSTTIDVGGATDKYFGGSATLAVYY